MLLATSGHIPLSPAKVVKANTLQRKIPTQLQPQGQKTKKFHYTEVLGDPHTVQACYPHFSQAKASCLSSMHGAAQHQLGHVRICYNDPNRCLPDCCFQESGIVELALPASFNRIGFAACVSCQQLQIFFSTSTDAVWAWCPGHR